MILYVRPSESFRMKKAIWFVSALCAALVLYHCETPQAGLVQSAHPETFDVHCASCHGVDLKGEIAQSLLDGSWQFGSRRNDIFRSIKFGHPHHGMPSWGLVLSDAEIDTLTDFLIAEEERLGVTKAAIPEQLETQDYLVNVETFVSGLDIPWSIDFTSTTEALITERSGRLRIVRDGVLLSDSVSGLPKVRVGGQGGLMDVTVDPDYSNNGWIYLAFSHPIAKEEDQERAPAMTSIVRGKIQDLQWTEQQILFEPHTIRIGRRGLTLAVGLYSIVRAIYFSASGIGEPWITPKISANPTARSIGYTKMDVFRLTIPFDICQTPCHPSTPTDTAIPRASPSTRSPMNCGIQSTAHWVVMRLISSSRVSTTDGR